MAPNTVPRPDSGADGDGRGPRKIDETYLAELRQRGDHDADEAAAHYLDRPPADLFRAARTAQVDDGTVLDPALTAWLAERPDLPEWAQDRARLLRGAHFYNAHGIAMGLGLFLASLPLAYASHDGVQALDLTAQLEKNTRRRILETAQFVIDVTRSGALEPNGRGYETTRRVRLVHAGVRQLIEKTISKDLAATPHWDQAWGVPVNQEHLIGTMISFTIPVFGALEKLHIRYNASAAEDYCYLWSVVGWILGIEESVLPMDRAELERLKEMILTKNARSSEGGQRLTAALIETVQSFMTMPLVKRPWPGSKGVPVSAMRMFIGDETADLLGVPPANWTRHVFKTLRPPKRRASLGLARVKVLRTAARRSTRLIFKGFVYATRDSGRPAFTMPTELGFGDREHLKYRKPTG